MKIQSVLCATAWTLCAALVFGTANAAPVTFNLVGSIYQVDSPLGPPFANNQPTSASVTFDTANVTPVSLDPNISTYTAPGSGVYNLGGYIVTFTQVNIGLLHFPSAYSEIRISAGGGVVAAPVNGLPLVSATFVLADFTATALTSADVFPAALAAADFNDSGILRLTFTNNGEQPGVLSTAGEVPVPAALPLFATGLGVMSLPWWHRRKVAG